MRSKRNVMVGLGGRVASSVGMRRRRIASLASVLFVLVLLPLMSACGNPRLSYVFSDGDHPEYRLSMTIAEKGASGETLGTVRIEALLRAEVNIDKHHPCACFVTVDYKDAKISTTGSAQSSGNQIPRAYFHLCEDRLLTFTEPAWRGDNCCVELARTGPNGSLSAMLLNTLVGKCLSQPLRDSRQELKIGNEWETTRQLPGEFLTYLYAGQRATQNQNWETTQARVTALTGDSAFADVAWSSTAPLQGSWQVDLTEKLLELGMDPSEIAVLNPGQWQTIRTVYGSCIGSGTTFVRMSDGWPQRASVERMTVNLISSWSYPDDPSLPEQIQPVEMILEITGSIEAIS